MGKKNKKEKKPKIIRQTTKEEREKFANEMRLMLTMNNYGFAASDRPRPTGSLGNTIVTYENVTQLKAVKELKIRLAVFVATGKTDEGFIEFPECNRRIEYVLAGDNIGKCSIKLKSLSDEQPYIFN